jgi:neutral ceramidase
MQFNTGRHILVPPGCRATWLAPCVLAALASLGTGRAHAADAVRSLQAGAGRAPIELPQELFPFQAEQFTSEHDKLQTKVVLLDDGATRIALVVIDMTALSTDVIDLVRGIVQSTAAVQADNIMVSASHTFSAPHVPGAQQAGRARERELMVTALSDAVRTSTNDALRGLRDARVGFGTGASSVNISRDLETREGWALGANEHGSSDKSVGVVRIDSAQGEPIAVLLNYAVQASTMNESKGADGGRAITADLAGAATRHIEQQYAGNMVALFLVGAAGDQSPVYVANRYTIDRKLQPGRADIGNAGFTLVELMGERLGAEAVRVSEAIRTAPLPGPLRIVQDSMLFTELDSSPNPAARQATRKHDYIPKGKAPMPYWILQIGDIVGVGVQVELASITGAAIKAQSPFRNTMVMTMVNGAAKYLPDADSFDRITYEALGARYARGSAEAFTTHVVQQLRRLQAEQPARAN